MTRKYDHDKIRRLSALGTMTVAEVAREVGCSTRQVERVKAAPRSGPDPEKLEAARLEREGRFEKARVLLEEEGQSYHMVAAQVRIHVRDLKARFPGHTWTREQTNESIIMARRLRALPSRIERSAA